MAAEFKYYRADGRMTNEGCDLEHRIAVTIKPFFKEKEAHPAEIAAMIHSAVETIRCETVLEGALDRLST